MKQPVIQFEQFTFKYHSQTEPSLIDMDLTIYEGEKVLIVGPSGSGKSTLAHCLNGLVPFSYKGNMTGNLLIKGTPTASLDIFTLSKMVGTVLQDTDGQFIGLSVGEDIAFTLENELVPQKKMHDIVEKTAKLVDIHHQMNYSIHELSGGQKQRVSLAGVMVDEEIDILLFDEPLANLDPATGKYAMELIERVHTDTNKTIIMIEHRIEDALHIPFDRIIVVNEGCIVADMTPDALLASDILSDVHIREPLYTKALKYHQCLVTEEMQPAHIDTLHISNQTKLALQQKMDEDFSTLTQPRANHTVLDVKDVTFSYDKKKIIDSISFQIKAGEMVAIIGKNGAGKSTLSKVICGFEKYSDGTIMFHDQDIRDKTIFERAKHVGYVLQNPNHMISKHMIYDEVALGLVQRGLTEEEIKERVYETLRICGLYPYRNWPISALSFGQKKRVTIASILVLNPSILILDEPTAGQDLRHYTEMMEFLLTLNRQGITIIFITHDMHLMLEYTNRALVLADGKLIADKAPVDILTDDQIIAKANLKRTSLFDLAIKSGMTHPKAFIEQFISHDRKVRKTWQ